MSSYRVVIDRFHRIPFKLDRKWELGVLRYEPCRRVEIRRATSYHVRIEVDDTIVEETKRATLQYHHDNVHTDGYVLCFDRSDRPGMMVLHSVYRKP